MVRTWWLVLAAMLVAGCAPRKPKPYVGPPVGLLGDSPLMPFPSIHLMVEDPATRTGWRVAIPEGLLPVSTKGTPLDLVRFNHRDGFSVAQPILVLLEDQDIDPASLPPETDVAASLAEDATVKIVDLATGERVPLFAEMDMAPEVTGPENRTMIIRPQKALRFGARYAVVLTTGIRLRGGGVLKPPPRFEALRDGRSPHPGLAAFVEHYKKLLDTLESYGIARSAMALAWDFWTASQESTHRTFARILERTTADLPADPSFRPTWTVQSIEDRASKPDLNPYVLRRVRGTFQVASFIDPKTLQFRHDADGLPVVQGHEDATFLLVVPASAATAAPGSFGVLFYGHGLMGSPEGPLGNDNDEASVLLYRICDELRLVVIATEWRGLSRRDELEAASAAMDFGRLPVVTDRIQQGVANALALPRLMRTMFREAEFLQAPGGGSIIDPDRFLYLGVSLGGIKGATFLANSDLVHTGVLHVAGGVWTLMLERSSRWEKFDLLMRKSTLCPVDRQVLYAVSQMLWDPVDPITHLGKLARKNVLWQQSIGDCQVSNLATEMVARSAGVPLILPAATEPCCIATSTGPLPAGSRGLQQFDLGCGRPEPGNRPAKANAAHSHAWRLGPAVRQIKTFLSEGTEGTIVPACGEHACIWNDCPSRGDPPPVTARR